MLKGTFDHGCNVADNNFNRPILLLFTMSDGNTPPAGPNFVNAPQGAPMGIHWHGRAVEVDSAFGWGTTTATGLKVFNPILDEPMSLILPWHSAAEWYSDNSTWTPRIPANRPAQLHATIRFGPGILKRRITIRYAWAPSSWKDDIRSLTKLSQLPSYDEVTVGSSDTIIQPPPIQVLCPFSSLMPEYIKGQYNPTNRPIFMVYAYSEDMTGALAGFWFSVHIAGAYAVSGGLLS